MINLLGCTNTTPSESINITDSSFNNEIYIENVKTNNVNYIGKGCFRSSNIKTIEFTNELNGIADRAFEYCLKLTNVNLPNSVTELGEYIFYNCINLSNIKLPENINYIPNGMFEVTFINNVSIPSNITHIGYKAIYNNVPDNVTHIDSCAFALSSIKEISLPSNLKTIETNAFVKCIKLKI